VDPLHIRVIHVVKQCVFYTQIHNARAVKSGVFHTQIRDIHAIEQCVFYTLNTSANNVGPKEHLMESRKWYHKDWNLESIKWNQESPRAPPLYSLYIIHIIIRFLET
jgi:hypothetical protein